MLSKIGKRKIMSSPNFHDQSRNINTHSYYENFNVFGIPVPAYVLAGGVVMLFAFFAMPWFTMILGFTGFDMVVAVLKSLTPGPYGYSTPTPWLLFTFVFIPIVGI